MSLDVVLAPFEPCDYLIVAHPLKSWALCDLTTVGHFKRWFVQALTYSTGFVCVSKADLIPEDTRDEFAAELRAAVPDVRWISAATGEGVDDLVAALCESFS